MRNVFPCNSALAIIAFSMAIASCSSEPLPSDDDNPSPFAAGENADHSGPCTLDNQDKMMTVEISADLCARFEKNKDDSNHRERVIITLNRDGERPDLSGTGIEILSETKNMPLVVGTITAEGLSRLSEMKQIIRIEPDGKMSIPEN